METRANYGTRPDVEQLEDASNDHAYFCMMPNMLDDLLDPYEYRVYAHIKRVCGEHGKHWQSTETMAETCKMSAGKVSEVKRTLVEKGLITITEKKRPKGGRPYHVIRVVDIWQKNILYCMAQASSSGEQASSSGELKKTPHEEDPRTGGATAPDAPADDDSWPTERAETPPRENPAQQQVERMRAKFGDNPFTVGAHCQEAQEAEGEWTVPKHRGLSPQCAVFKEATGYRPAKAIRSDIDEYVPADDVERLQFWYDVCHTWVLLGWNPTNAKGMLDHFILDTLPSTKSDGNRNGGSSGPRTSKPVGSYEVAF